MATLALNAGEWFRRGRLLIFCAPENTGSILAHRSSSSTYRRVQFCATTSQGSIADEGLLNRLLGRGFDAVMHFASFIQVGESVRQPAKYYINNVVNTLTLLEAMRSHGVLNFIFSSTAATFGEPKYSPIDERHPQRPINPYGRTKLIVEQVLADYDAAYGLKSVCLR
jgi:UDP-glucose 4-epimerase